MESSMKHEQLLVQILSERGIKSEIIDKRSLQKAQSLYSDMYVDLAFSSEDNENLIREVEQRLNESIKEHLMDNDTSLFVSANQEIIVSPSSKKVGSFQITFFDKNGPIMDLERSTKDDVFKELKLNFCTPLRREFAEFVAEPSNINIKKIGVEEMDKKIEKLYEEIIDLETDILDLAEYKDFTDIDFIEEAKNNVENYILEDYRTLRDDSTYHLNDELLNHTLDQKREEYMKNEMKEVEYKKERLEELSDTENQIKDKFSELKLELNLPEDTKDQEVIDEVSNVLFPEKEVNLEYESGKNEKGVNKTTKWVNELENVDLLVNRHVEQLEKEGIYSAATIDDLVTNNFLNSKIEDIDYLLEDLNVSINDGTVVDLTYKSEILEMMDKDYSNFVQSLISIETKITDKEILSQIYENYMDTDNITLISPEFYKEIAPRIEKNVKVY